MDRDRSLVPYGFFDNEHEKFVRKFAVNVYGPSPIKKYVEAEIQRRWLEYYKDLDEYITKIIEIHYGF